MATNRWFFYSSRSDDTFIYEGNPEKLPSFKGWVSTKTKAGAKKIKSAGGKFVYKEPSVMFEGVLYFGRLLTATKIEGAPCSTNCRRATHPFCKCSCLGKNHGIDNPELQEEDVIYRG